ncbi:MAG: alpha-L-rhamnosidase C-terminal domain-containing protein [Flavicella sp.]
MTTCKCKILILICSFVFAASCKTKSNDASSNVAWKTEILTKHTGDIEREYVPAKRIIWTSKGDKSSVKGANRLLEKGTGQAILSRDTFCTMLSDSKSKASIVLDFGRELHGGLQIITGQYAENRPVNLRIRFGESVGETMAEIGGVSNGNARNDHAIRDWNIKVPWLGKIELGNTGFRFVRIDVLDADIELIIKEVNAISVLRDIPYLGSFNSDSERLNKIWKTGAYTVHLNMQDYLWDGIKRDRLVWVGDMHPEVNTINAVFGNSPLVPKTMDLSKAITPPTAWMNGISSYSLWWLIIQYDWYLANGDLEYLKEQEGYIVKLVENLTKYIDPINGEVLNGMRFLDWPTKGNEKAVHMGLNALFSIAMDKTAKLGIFIENAALEEKCKKAKSVLDAHVPELVENKQANALTILAGNGNKNNIDKIKKGGVAGISAFYGYYVLEALAESGEIDIAMAIIDAFWGGMLDMGATSFWEEFELSEKEISGRIDELPSDKLKNYHAETGRDCYIGYRRSLCHGWAAGPTPWLSKYVLGIQIMEPGARKVKIEPHLGKLNWVEGSYPTPLGIIRVRHEKLASGEIQSEINLPEGIELIN